MVFLIIRLFETFNNVVFNFYTQMPRVVILSLEKSWQNGDGNPESKNHCIEINKILDTISMKNIFQLASNTLVLRRI